MTDTNVKHPRNPNPLTQRVNMKFRFAAID